MQAIILAAGMGKRLKDLTTDNTKCMVKVNGVSLIQRMLRQLDELGLARIVIVVGYMGDKLIDYISTLNTSTPIEFIENPVYDKTNNIYSLFLAKKQLCEDDTLLLESDLIFEEGILLELVNDPRPTLALVDKYESWMDGTVVTIDEYDRIESFIPGKRFSFDKIPSYYKTVNIYKFSRDFSRTHYVPFLEAYSIALGNNEYYEQVLRVITMLDDSELRAKRLQGQSWYEIDDLQDLDIAESIFADDAKDQLVLMQGRYGGYWRYPQMTDFCYLVNPYFPSQRLLDEMKASFEILLTQYPSGMRINSLLAAKTFGVHQEKIIIGNGAAELIKSLLVIVAREEKRIGFVRPTFEEYPNRYPENLSECFVPENDNFSYSADELMEYFENTDISTLVLINPDNPSGNYIKKKDVKRLASWCESKDIRLILDESFADFSDEPDNTFVDDSLLEDYPHMVVIKSISKSHGVPGARLGILASANTNLIDELKKDVSIWNINSFGEFYMQIAEKYKGDYRISLDKLRKSRAKLISDLAKNPHLRVIPSQANYIMLEVIGGMSSTEVTTRLLCEDNIFIKDLSAKVRNGNRQYLRVAVRNESDNIRLVRALNSLLR
jgi:histidinol-phosphate/aromatic aminotransferase/cobyric acid decarboxylase-like protein/choline kinase